MCWVVANGLAFNPGLGYDFGCVAVAKAVLDVDATSGVGDGAGVVVSPGAEWDGERWHGREEVAEVGHEAAVAVVAVVAVVANVALVVVAVVVGAGAACAPALATTPPRDAEDRHHEQGEGGDDEGYPCGCAGGARELEDVGPGALNDFLDIVGFRSACSHGG